MRVIIFGASGMVGQGVLRECLLDDQVSEVLAVVRRPLEERPRDVASAKLRELVHRDFGDFEALAEAFSGYDACFFCLGRSSAGMKEPAYRAVTYDLTLAAARVMARVSPGMTFQYVSGAGTGGRSMWARVKGETEGALLRLPFKAAYMMRPGLIQPKHGIKSRTRWLRGVYAGMTPLMPVLRLTMGKLMTTTEELGRVMLHVAKHGATKPILENRDIGTIARGLAKP